MREVTVLQLESFVVPTKFQDVAFSGFDFGARRVLGNDVQLHFPAGLETTSEGRLKEDLIIPSGVVLHRSRGKYSFYTNGMEDFRSGVMRIKQYEEITDTEVVMYAREAVTSGVYRVRNYRILNEADKGRIVRLNDVASRGLGRARNEWKVHAALLLHHAKSIRDKRGRVNPGKTQAQLAAAEQALMIREEEIRGILGYISRDALISETALWAVRNEFIGIEEAMKTWQLRLRDPDHPRLSKEERADLGLAFRACAKRLREHVVIRPYRPSAEWLAGELEAYEGQVAELLEAKIYHLLSQVVQAVAAQSHRAKVLGNNVELGLIEESPRHGDDLKVHLLRIADETRATMAKGMAGVPTDSRDEARRHFEEVKKLFAANRTLGADRKWLKFVRMEVRAFAGCIA